MSQIVLSRQLFLINKSL